MGTVTVVVCRVAGMTTIATHHTDTVHIIHEPIAIVIDTVIRDFQRIDPHVAHQIRVAVIHAGINHGNSDVFTATGGQAV